MLERLHTLYAEREKLSNELEIIQDSASLMLEPQDFDYLSKQKADIIKRKRQVEHEITCIEEQESTY